MPSATADGLPYPTGTDPVRDGDNAIANLAGALSRRNYGKRTEARRITVTPNGFGNAVITFARPFTNLPVMTALVWGDENTGRWATFAGSQIANNYVGLFIYSHTGARITDTVQIMYIAVGDDPNV
jgi:hypothetical protein